MNANDRLAAELDNRIQTDRFHVRSRVVTKRGEWGYVVGITADRGYRVYFPSRRVTGDGWADHDFR